MPKKIEMLGKRFGRLVVISECSPGCNGSVRWVCQCDCGNITNPIYGTTLRNGTTVSCGCYQKERVRQTMEKHGQYNTKLYYVWRTMKRRCFVSSDKQYINYGGRGITMHAEWKDSFETFRDYVTALPNYGTPGYSIDRIDNDKNYEPGNIRYASKEVQSNNTRRNVPIEINGITKNMSQWSRLSGVSATTIYYRYKRGVTGSDLLKKGRT